MKLALFFALMALCIPYSEAQRQPASASGVAKDSIQVDLPTSQRQYKPKILLQAALKIAESYVTAEDMLTSTPNPSTIGQAVTFTAKITSPTLTVMGPVTFTLGKTTLGTAQLSGGHATFTTSSLPIGSNVIKVTYDGNWNIARSAAAVTQVVQP